MAFSVYNELSQPTESSYKLVQLPKELLEYMKNGSNKPLQFKAPTSVKNQLALCTETTTYSVRQMNHSNTQLIMTDMAINKYSKSLEHTTISNPPNQLLAMGSASFIYELAEIEGTIETQGVPRYEGASTDLSESAKTVADVYNDSVMAPHCFKSRWHAIGGCAVDGKAVMLSPKLLSDVLHTVISLMIADDTQSYGLEEMASAVAEQNRAYSKEMVETVTSKFGDLHENTCSLDTERVAKWFGIETLRNNKSVFTESELLLEWKSRLPAFYNASLDLKLLLGHYCRPSTGKIRYLNPDSLDSDLHSRIKEMFQIVREWDYEEFLPFVRRFVPASKKADTIILKYARKKRVGKKFVVCSR